MLTHLDASSGVSKEVQMVRGDDLPWRKETKWRLVVTQMRRLDTQSCDEEIIVPKIVQQKPNMKMNPIGRNQGEGDRDFKKQ
jgi:hypothetical protein